MPCRTRSWSDNQARDTLIANVSELNLRASRAPSVADGQHTDLLRRVAMQDADAFAALYDCLSRPLYSIALHMLGGAPEAEEVIQDVFVQIWNGAASFDSTLGTPHQWTARMTRNRCIDYLRARQRRARLADEVTTETEMLSLPGESPARQALSREEIAKVRCCVKELPPEQQRVIDLAFFRGMTHAEIAEATGEPLGTIKARIRRGMMKLKDNLKAYL